MLTYVSPNRHGNRAVAPGGVREAVSCFDHHPLLSHRHTDTQPTRANICKYDTDTNNLTDIKGTAVHFRRYGWLLSCSESDDKDDTSLVFVFGNNIEASSHTLSQGLEAILNVQQPPYTAFVYLHRKTHHRTVTSITAVSEFGVDFSFVFLHDNQHIVNNV